MKLRVVSYSFIFCLLALPVYAFTKRSCSEDEIWNGFVLSCISKKRPMGRLGLNMTRREVEVGLPLIFVNKISPQSINFDAIAVNIGVNRSGGSIYTLDLTVGRLLGPFANSLGFGGYADGSGNGVGIVLTSEIYGYFVRYRSYSAAAGGFELGYSLSYLF